MYHDTITLFNRSKNADGDIWFPTILRDVNVNIDKAAIAMKYGDRSEDNVILNVRYSPLSGRRVISVPEQLAETKTIDGGTFNPWNDNVGVKGGTFEEWDTVPISTELTWVPPKEWQRLEDKTGYITFASGAAHDFFWCGEWGGGSTIYDDNYGDMSFYDYMLINYDYVYAITSVGLFTVIPHFEVTGR